MSKSERTRSVKETVNQFRRPLISATLQEKMGGEVNDPGSLCYLSTSDIAVPSNSSWGEIGPVELKDR